ncbi:MAG: anti-sigma factor family protein [Candidatus Hydrogenedentota bacterium]
MSKHVSLKELSTYLDGEARRAGRIQQHLQECSECARVYSQLESMQAFLRETPQEKVGPSFAARVMGAVREQAQPSKGWAKRYPWALAASAAAVLLCAGLGVFAVLEFEEAQTPLSDEETASDVEPLVQAWLGEMEETFPAEGSQDQFVDELAYLDVLLTMAADPEVEETMPAAYEDEQDVDELVETLDEESADIFVELLATYDQGSWSP